MNTLENKFLGRTTIEPRLKVKWQWNDCFNDHDSRVTERGLWMLMLKVALQKSQRAFSDSQIAGIGCLIMTQLRPLIRNKILLKLRMAQTDWWDEKASIGYGLNHLAKQMWHQTVSLIGTPQRGWRNEVTPPLSKRDTLLRNRWGFFSTRRSFWAILALKKAHTKPKYCNPE